MKIKFAIISLLFITIASCSINATCQNKWTLDSCINYAIANNITVKQRALDTKSAEYDIVEAKDQFLPHVEAGASQSFNFGRGLTSENTYANRNTSQLGWNIGLNLPLFQGLSAKRRLDYSKANLLAIIENEKATIDNITLQIIAQYLQILCNEEIHTVAMEQVRISSVELERRQQLFEAGKIAELDVIQAQSQLAQDQLTAVTTENDYKLSLVNLAEMLHLIDIEGFSIAPLDNKEIIPDIPYADDVFSNALQSNHTILASKYSIDAAVKNISLAKSGYLPKLSFNAGVGSSYYNISGIDNPPFHRQMRDNFNKSVGFSLSIPIFDAFSTRNSVRKAKLQKLNAELQYEDQKNNLFQTIRQSYYQAIAAKRKFEASQTALTATKSAFDAMELKYNYGKANSTEFEEAKTNYIKALSNLTSSKYEALLRIKILDFYNHQ